MTAGLRHPAALHSRGSSRAMADLAEHSEELAELERRVEELENVIGTQKDGDSIDEAVKSIDAQLSARVTPDQRKLFEIYTSHKQLVEQPLQFAASDADLAMEHLEDIRAMAKQLEELDQLKDQINPAYLSGVCSSSPPPHPQKGGTSHDLTRTSFASSRRATLRLRAMCAYAAFTPLFFSACVRSLAEIPGVAAATERDSYPAA